MRLEDHLDLLRDVAFLGGRLVHLGDERLVHLDREEGLRACRSCRSTCTSPASTVSNDLPGADVGEDRCSTSGRTRAPSSSCQGLACRPRRRRPWSSWFPLRPPSPRTAARSRAVCRRAACFDSPSASPICMNAFNAAAIGSLRKDVVLQCRCRRPTFRATSWPQQIDRRDRLAACKWGRGHRGRTRLRLAGRDVPGELVDRRGGRQAWTCRCPAA